MNQCSDKHISILQYAVQLIEPEVKVYQESIIELPLDKITQFDK